MGALHALAAAQGVNWTAEQCHTVLDMMLERVAFLPEIMATGWLFEAPSDYNAKLVRKKWKEETAGYLHDLSDVLGGVDDFTSENVETAFKGFLSARTRVWPSAAAIVPDCPDRGGRRALDV